MRRVKDAKLDGTFPGAIASPIPKIACRIYSTSYITQQQTLIESALYSLFIDKLYW